MNEIIGVVIAFWIWLEGVVSSFWTGLNWPHAVLIIFILFVVFYRQEIRALIERILEIGPTGFKLQPPLLGSQQDNSEKVEIQSIQAPQPAEELPTSTEVVPPQGGEGHPMPLPPIHFPEQMAISKSHIDFEIDGMADEKAKHYLAERLAFTRSLWIFENCYSCIFGGQIRLLQIINQRVGRTISLSEVNYYWISHQEQVKPTLNLWTAEGYLHYLVANGLVTKTPDSVTMTNKGSEFLLWLVNYGRPLDRPL